MKLLDVIPIRFLRELIIILLIIVVIVFGLYLYKLHDLALEGNKIFEYRCLNVNPHLIGYKNTFLKYADHMNNPDWADGDQMWELMNSYIDQMRLYVEAENKWLEMDKQFNNRWDYKLIEPDYIQYAGYLQWKMYEGYRDDALTMLDTWDHPEKAKIINDPTYVSEERQRRDEYSRQYYEFFDMAVQINDWRKFFAQVPIPAGCTQENTRIPNTSGSIKWQEEGGESTPSSVPIDPYFTS